MRASASSMRAAMGRVAMHDPLVQVHPAITNDTDDSSEIEAGGE